MELVGDDAKTGGFPPPQSHPWLLFCQNKQGTLYSITQQRHYKVDYSFMYNKYERAHTCKDGWMVLHDCDDTFDILLFNVYSHERVQLPKLKSVTHFAYLSSSPHDPSCYVVLIKKDNDSDYFFSFCKIGEQEFVKQRLCDNRHLIQSFTSFGGNLYGLRKFSTSLVRVEFKGQSAQFHEVISGDLSRESSSRPIWSGYLTIGYITESCGEILLIIKIYTNKHSQVKDIQVFRADLCARKWVEMETIGERTIFLGSVGGIICINSNNATNVRSNCIYFIEENDRNIYVFDLEDRSISFDLPCPSCR